MIVDAQVIILSFSFVVCLDVFPYQTGCSGLQLCRIGPCLTVCFFSVCVCFQNPINKVSLLHKWFNSHFISIVCHHNNVSKDSAENEPDCNQEITETKLLDQISTFISFFFLIEQMHVKIHLSLFDIQNQVNMHKQQYFIHFIQKYTVLGQSNQSLDSSANIILYDKYSPPPTELCIKSYRRWSQINICLRYTMKQLCKCAKNTKASQSSRSRTL